MNLLGGDAQLLAEQFAQFAGHQSVIGPDRAGLRATPAEVAAIGEFGHSRHQRPVQLDVTVLEGRQQTAVFDVLVVEPPHDFGAIGRAVHLVLPTRFVEVTGIGARLALGAVLHRHLELLQVEAADGRVVTAGLKVVVGERRQGLLDARNAVLAAHALDDQFNYHESSSGARSRFSLHLVPCRVLSRAV